LEQRDERDRRCCGILLGWSWGADASQGANHCIAVKTLRLQSPTQPTYFVDFDRLFRAKSSGLKTLPELLARITDKTGYADLFFSGRLGRSLLRLAYLIDAVCRATDPNII
jgi:hypothetical protein